MSLFAPPGRTGTVVGLPPGCDTCRAHHAAHHEAMADDPRDEAFISLNLVGWLGHLEDDHPTEARP